MDDAVQEGARGQHDRPGAKGDTLARRHAHHAVAVQHQGLGSPGHQGQVRRPGQLGLHRLAVETPVDLAARASDRGALGPVQHTELDARHIGQPSHQPVQRIDLTHQMPLAQPTDSRVAAHLADGFQLLGQQQGAGASARRRSRSFAAGVAAADHDDVEGVGGTHGRGHRRNHAQTPLTRCFT